MSSFCMWLVRTSVPNFQDVKGLACIAEYWNNKQKYDLRYHKHILTFRNTTPNTNTVSEKVNKETNMI